VTNSDWWDRANSHHASSRSEIPKGERLYTLRKETHAVSLEKRPVFGVGEELILSVNAWVRACRTGGVDVTAL
jgi:hypothetical protein